MPTPIIPSLTSYVSFTTVTAAGQNNNEALIRDNVNLYCAAKDVANTWTDVQTFSVAPVFSAGVSLTGTLTMATAASKIVPGATSLSLRNNADSADNVLVSNAGAVTIRAGLTVTAGGATITAGGLTVSAGTTAVGDLTVSGSFTPAGISIAGNLTMSGASRKLISSTSSLVFRNSGDTTTWLSYTDGGNVTLGGTGVDAFLGVAAPATNAASGFPIIPVMAGTPTGAATNGAFLVDSSGSKLWVRVGGAWKGVVVA